MEQTDVPTLFGPVRFWGRFSEFEDSRPLVVAIAGAHPAEDQLWGLDGPEADFVFLHLPGFYAPRLKTTAIVVFAAAFEAALARRYPDRAYVAVGVSTGALVALAMSRARAVVAVEPFFSTAPLWALHEIVAKIEMNDVGRAWGDAILGGPQDNRAYHEILHNLTAPTEVVVGADPLMPPRRFAKLPSLTSEEDRASLSALPNVRITEVAGGHDIPQNHPEAVRLAVTRALAAAGLRA